ncbi:ABC transporter substrate-binding protein [Erwinia mallotivora]|uniref:ABC transporter substrate-binding protein n=1 Tax=Erwinia mallotivora TaxID=69222 RepID=UPI0004BA977A
MIILQHLRYALMAGVMLFCGFALAGSENHSEIRVATPWPAQSTIIAMLGYSRNIVGTSAVAQRIPLFRQIYPDIIQVPVVSVTSAHEIHPEQVIALRAQLLIIPQNMHLSQAGVLARASIKTLALPANSLTALRQRVTLTAQALGPDAQAQDRRYQAYFDRNLNLVRQRLRHLPDTERVKVYHSMGSPLITSGRPSLNQDWMDVAGAENEAESWFPAKKNGAGEVPLEKIVAANPQVIVAMNARDAAAIRENPAWQGTLAVQHQRVYTNPQGLFWWCRETSESALQILWLAKTLYPQHFADIDMVQETRAFYRRFFAVTLSTAQIEKILHPE